MVKNTASMQSTRESMDDLTLSSPPNTQARTPQYHPQNQTPQTAQQPNVSLNQPTQLVGTDAYTKYLMNRIATGAANPEEKAQWEQHVAAVKAGPTSPDDAQRAQWERHIAEITAKNPHVMTGLDYSQMPSPVRPVPSTNNLGPTSRVWMPLAPPEQNGAPMSEHVRQEYELQLILLEQQNKKRIAMARAEQDALMHADSPKPKHEREREQRLMRSSEQQNKRRMAMARPEQDAVMHAQSPNLDREGQQQFSLLEQQNKVRLDMERAEWEKHPEQFMELNQQIKTMQDEIRAGQAQRHASNEVADAQRGLEFQRATRQNAAKYTEPFCKFLTDNPTVFHAVDAVKQQLKDAGFTELSERDSWDLKAGGSYFVERNGSALIAFTVGGKYESGNGAAILAGHVDALTAKLKPISQVPNKAGYVQLGVAPYAGAPNNTWWDRDLGIGGRVLVKEGDKIVTKLVKLDWPIARIPTLAPHFGAAANGPFNPETQMTPIIGLDGTDSSFDEHAEPFSSPPLIHGAHDGANAFVHTQPPRLVKAIGNALGLRVDTYSSIVNWELELFDTQPATVGGLDKEFIFAGRIDDKLCSWAAIQALVETKDDARNHSSLLQVVGLFDDEEIGSGLRQGARSNFLPSILERAVGALADHQLPSDIMGRTYANSFLVSSDVIHA
ncbi:hypothetical protein B0A55_04529, partial [Friedmanniomyces simplex]